MTAKQITFVATQVNDGPIQIHYFTESGVKITPETILQANKENGNKTKAAKRTTRKSK